MIRPISMRGRRSIVRGVRGLRLRRGSRATWLSSLLLVVALGCSAMGDATYTIRGGDTLASIARRFGTTASDLARQNGIANPNLIIVGRQLRIALSAAPPPAASPISYTVKTGDTLTAIAKQYGTTVEAIAHLNNLRSRHLIRAGSKILVPPASRDQVEQLLNSYAAQYKVDPALVKGLAWQESGWQQKVTSPTGAVGVMQVMPETAHFTARNIVGHELDPAHLEHNIKAGVAFLAFLLRQTNGDESMAVAGYYQGLRSVRQKGMLPETKRYVANVLALRDRFRTNIR